MSNVWNAGSMVTQCKEQFKDYPFCHFSDYNLISHPLAHPSDTFLPTWSCRCVNG